MFQFPAAPTLNQVFTPATGISYRWNGTGWVLITPTLSTLLPSGVIMPFAGATLPDGGWLWCDGNYYATANYPALFAAIGYSYGSSGAGANFAMPDFRGRAPVGKDDMGTTGTAGRLTAALSGIAATTLGAAGGAETVALTTAQLPSHSHGGITSAQTANHSHSGVSGNQNQNHTHNATTSGVSANHVHSGSTGIESNDHTHVQYGSTSTGQIMAGGGIGDMQLFNSSGVSANHTHAFSTGTESADHYHTLSTTTELQVHTHSFTTGVESAIHQHYVSAEGSGTAHLNVQPTFIINYIIKT